MGALADEGLFSAQPLVAPLACWRPEALGSTRPMRRGRTASIRQRSRVFRPSKSGLCPVVCELGDMFPDTSSECWWERQWS